MKEVIHLKTNSEVLKWARNSIALSKQNAADRIGITIARLEQIESGKFPDIEELKSMAKAYKRTIATLLLQSVPSEKPLPKDRRTVNSELINVFGEKTIFAVRKARALVNSLLELREETNQVYPKFSLKADISDSPEVLAEGLRKQWKLDEYRQIENVNHALDAYIELVESLGVAVFQIRLPEDNIRGFSLIDEPIPVIVIKGSSEHATAKIFTLFHELGHIILNDGGICDINFNNKAQQIEKWCNSFASELLVPAEQLLKMEIVQKYTTNNIKIWVKNDLVELANHFHIGPLAMLRCLLKNGLTTSDFYKEKHEKWNKPNFGYSTVHEGRNIPKEIIKERGRTYLNLAFQAFDQNKIDLKDLSDFLGIRLSYIPKTRQLLTA
jgi:Zn-dependent peptidase ImmA (M78 family)/DNA-binding XRE family transcriptional regulator